ncbi:zinc finger and SCAN domain-containing protein 2-like [Notolabrus celidotus]|uniref:zinc finger and SCAN domain-containing protein 2-like n=1 Tax=Notolabrus celidotus TaxID=1203425 RepID=UPI0014905FEB|nr:zinc finger and SCAN domain-containing protein 2-like [Notolabrus celidotus]
MSLEQQRFPPPSSSVPPGEQEALPGVSSRVSPPPEMETLRLFVNERLTAAVEDILEVIGNTVCRYREQIEVQRRQLDLLQSEESSWKPGADPPPVSSWIKRCPDEPILTDSVDETDASAAQVKTEDGGEDCGSLEPNGDFDPAGGSEGASESRLFADCSDTEDSGDYWRESAGFWRPEDEKKEASEGQSSSQGVRMTSSSDFSLEPEASRQPAPVFGCKVCGESYQRISHLLTHASAHLRDCGLCGKHLEETENLKDHLRGHRETSFCCRVCGQSFTLRGNLRIHMMIHSGERPYACTVCGKSFGRRATLVRHVRSHTGEKPFICTYCGHGFVEKGNLTVHLRTHTGERPYWCSNCDRRFSQLSSFNKHPCHRRGLTSDGCGT